MQLEIYSAGDYAETVVVLRLIIYSSLVEMRLCVDEETVARLTTHESRGVESLTIKEIFNEKKITLSYYPLPTFY